MRYSNNNQSLFKPRMAVRYGSPQFLLRYAFFVMALVRYVGTLFEFAYSTYHTRPSIKIRATVHMQLNYTIY